MDFLPVSYASEEKTIEFFLKKERKIKACTQKYKQSKHLRFTCSMTVYRAPMYMCYRFFRSLSNLVGWPVGGYHA